MSGNTTKILVCAALVMASLVALPLVASAGTMGQVKGRVVDAETGEPVIGASVMVVGTARGEQTDLDGYYIIPRLDPGTYTLSISHLDYTKVEITDVQVQMDLTTEQNQEMVKKVTELDEKITVVGKRDIIDPYEVSSQVSITQETIQHRPVQTVDALLKQVAGVQTTSTGEVFIRGGRAGEVAYIVDGVPIGDPLGGLGETGANLSLVSGSIQEIQIIKDGFDPEFGNALSGIVNIRSRVGSKDNTRVNMQYLTDDLGHSSLNEYSRNYDFLRFSVSGPDPILRSKVLPALGLNFLEDKELTYYMYAEMEKHDGIYQYDSYDSPSTGREWPSFNLLGFDIPERLYNRYHFESNFKFRPKQNLKFVFSYKKWITRRTLFGRDQWDYRYSSATAPVLHNNQHTVSLEIAHSVTKDMNYEVIISNNDLEIEQWPGDPFNPGRGIDPEGFFEQGDWESWEDTILNGVYDPPEPIINLFPDTASYGSGFSGPGYTFGEGTDLQNNQGGGSHPGNFRFNDNGVVDSLEGEPFIDLNGNGVWDAGEYLHDKNGNGRLDRNRLSPIDGRTPEPYIDGDSVLGEPFVDINANSVYEIGIDIFVITNDPLTNQDLNHNGRHDGPEAWWTPGIPFYDRNGNGIYDRANARYDPGEPYTDVNQNGKYDYGTFLDPLQYDEDATWHHRRIRTWRGEVKVYRQMGRHELKAGCAIARDEVTFEEIERPYVPFNGVLDTLQPYPYRGAYRDFYHYRPWKGTLYARDKLEYGSMIASLGLRWDFFLQDVDSLQAMLVRDDRGGLIQGDRHKLSPRIGFSYPISDKAKVYFNYGHFFQLPQLRLMYARNSNSVNQNDIVGNPNLDYVKTIMYSFGVKYAMSESYSIDVQGYFKDEFDKVNSKRVREGAIYRQAQRNCDYGRSRGFELTLEKRGGGYVNGEVNYTYAFAFGKASQTNEDYLTDFLLSREPLTEAPLENDIRHSLKAGIQIYMPSTVKPRLFGLPIPNGWSMSIQSIIESGRPFTPDGSYPDISQTGTEDIERNSMRYPSTAVFDVKFAKEAEFVGIDWEFICWVENVFDSRNVEYVYPNTGRPDTDQNQSQVIFGGTEYSMNPYNWDYGRQIRVGLEMKL